MVLYDIINLTDTNFKLNQQTVHEAMTKNSVRLRSEPSADKNNIPQTNTNVNTGTQKNSDGDLYDVISESNRLNVENQELKKTVEYYKSEMHRTKAGEVPNYETFRKLANRIAKGYTGDTDLKVALSEAWRMAAKSIKYSGNVEETNRFWDRYTEMAQDISWDIATNTLVKNDENAKMFKDIKSALRNKRIFIPEKYRNELDGGYAEFRKKNFGKFKLADGGVPLDVVYFELNGAFGEIFPSDITDPIEQINVFVRLDIFAVFDIPLSENDFLLLPNGTFSAVRSLSKAFSFFVDITTILCYNIIRSFNISRIVSDVGCGLLSVFGTWLPTAAFDISV